MNSVAAGEDAALVGASLGGDREAFGLIVARYQSLVCSMAYSATGSLPQSEDLAQETFLEAWKHLASLREPGKLRAWLCGIARNRIHQWLRSQGREPSHQAEPLEAVSESPCVEPAPGERAISQEEADILWRALERIPDTYRLPLVLFYREHQSIENVAQSLELTEEAARQRLSRGRKLLQAEVQSFVESALGRTTPGKTFTMGVLAALPLTATTAKAAAGATVAKGAASAKGIAALPLIAGFASMVGAIMLSWKFTADEGKSARERKFLRRVGAVQVAVVTLVLAGSSVMGLFSSNGLKWFSMAMFGLVALGAAINSVFVLPWMVRRQLEIRAEDGGMAFEPPEKPGATEHSVALRRALKQSLPIAVMLAGCVWFLPWKKNWLGCLGYLALPVVCVLFQIRRVYRQMRYPAPVNSWWRQNFAKHPILMGAGAAFAMCLFCMVFSNFGVRYLFWLQSGKVPDLPLATTLNSHMLIGLLVAAVVFALFALAVPKLFPALGLVGRKFQIPYLEGMTAAASGGPGAILEKMYRPLFDDLNLDEESVKQLKDLLLQRSMVGVRAGMPLMNPCLAREKRAELLRSMEVEVDSINSKVRELLGEGFAVFKEYERSIPERMLLDQFASKTANTRLALSEEKMEGFREALLAARRDYPWTSDLALQNQGVGCSRLYTEENLAAFVREQAEFDRLFQAPAAEHLSVEQLAVFEQVRAKFRRSQLGQFKMSLKLMGS
jgi:RNA polymerase sigma factor (sigma-70 family)